MLAERVDELLDEVLRRSGGEAPVPAVAPADATTPTRSTCRIEEDFRVGTMALAWDDDDERVVIEAQAVDRGRHGRRGRRSSTTTRGRAAAAAGPPHRRGGPGVRQARARPGRGRPAAVPASAAARSTRRARLPARQRLPPLTATRGTTGRRDRDRRRQRAAAAAATARSSVEGRLRRRVATRRCSATSRSTARDGALRLQAGRGGAAAVGLPRRHAGRARGRGVRGVRGDRLGRRAADGAARRAVRAGHVPAVGRRRRRRRRWSTSCRRAGSPTAGCASLDALGSGGQPVVLVHADDARLRRMAVLDAVVNNADRKGGHVLPLRRRPGARRRPRGVLPRRATSCAPCCGAGPVTPLSDDGDRRVLTALAEQLDGELGDPAGGTADRRRGARDRGAGVRPACSRPAGFRAPAEGWPAIPWPPF